MKRRQTEQELNAQEYRQSGRFNDELQEAINNMRSAIKSIAADHSDLWREHSVNVAEYEAIRKAARKTLSQSLASSLPTSNRNDMAMQTLKLSSHSNSAAIAKKLFEHGYQVTMHFDGRFYRLTIATI